MDLLTALKLVSKQSMGQKHDSSKINEAKQVIARETKEVPCPSCGYWKVPKCHADAGITCLPCINAKYR